MGNSRLTPISNHRRLTNPKLAEIIEKALAVEPEKRYQNAADFREELLATMPASEKTMEITAKTVKTTQNRIPPEKNSPNLKRSLALVIGTALAVIIFIALVASAESIIRNLVPKNQFPTALLSTDLPPTQLTSKPATIHRSNRCQNPTTIRIRYRHDSGDYSNRK